jgi:hypothetical protein
MVKKAGILATPGVAKNSADGLHDTLSNLLSTHFDSSVNWEVDIIEEASPGAAINFKDLYSTTERYVKKHKWSYVIALTDLPIFDGKKVVAIDINKDNGAILISISAFGWGPIRKRMKHAILTAIDEVNNLNNDPAQRTNKHFNSKMFQQKFSPIFARRTDEYIKATETNHIRYIIAPSFGGKLQLVTGMTRANNPFNMMKSLTSSIALSFTTGAFGMVFTTMWQLSYTFSELRLTVLSLASIFAMVVWIILAHNLWETASSKKEKYVARLYNSTTVVTLFISVLTYYMTLFVLFLITCLTIIPPDFLGKTLGLSGAASFLQFVEIAWLAASIATVAGAIGVGLTNEKLVKESTFGHRQQNRYKLIYKNKSNKD